MLSWPEFKNNALKHFTKNYEIIKNIGSIRALGGMKGDTNVRPIPDSRSRGNAKSCGMIMLQDNKSHLHDLEWNIGIEKLTHHSILKRTNLTQPKLWTDKDHSFDAAPVLWTEEREET